MVAMGGGPNIPVRGSASKEKELVLCTLPWPEDQASAGIKELKEAFGDVEVKYYHTKYANGKMEPVDVSEGMLRKNTTAMCRTFSAGASDPRSCLFFLRPFWVRGNGLVSEDSTESLHDPILTFSSTHSKPSLSLAFTAPN